jgi:hypothetical protein
MVHRDGQQTSLRALAEGLRRDGAFREAGGALYHGHEVRLFVAEAGVEVEPLRRGRRDGGKTEVAAPGPRLPLRLVVAEARDLNGRVLARWPLLTNVPAGWAGAATVAQWYSFRARVGSLPKLLTRAGWPLEGWLRHTGRRPLTNLLIAFGACAEILALERRHDAGSGSFQGMLISLSDRPAKPGRATWTIGLLAGLWGLHRALGRPATPGLERLNELLEEHLPRFARHRRKLHVLAETGAQAPPGSKG